MSNLRYRLGLSPVVNHSKHSRAKYTKVRDKYSGGTDLVRWIRVFSEDVVQLSTQKLGISKPEVQTWSESGGEPFEAQ